ncbi:isochorismate synthase [Alicyclobacillus hesperidum]|uniref:isochorismate synthase n=2 Tax=Alicyclobacillus hesperidum TaxID=89784 RepID=A0A1H2U3N4_9BACL|nr:isochorismate synthase [Alicyclobacillus hesperidum]
MGENAMLTSAKETVWEHLVDAIAQAYTRMPPADEQGFHCIRTTIKFQEPLASLTNWHTLEPAVYSLPHNADAETLGIGVYKQILESEEDALERSRTRLSELALPKGVRCYGAFAFDFTEPAFGMWSAWPKAIWFVPKLTLRKQLGTDAVEVFYIASPALDEHDVRTEVADLLDAFAASEHEPGAHPVFAAALENTAWADKVERALREIAAGKLSKVVLARRAFASVNRPLPEALQQLLSTYRDSHIFAMKWQDRWLLAASPEELVRVEERTLSVDCLAGSARRGRDKEEDRNLCLQLQTSAKNRAEHEAVVHSVTHRLASVAEQLTWPKEPGIRQLTNVQHLYTKVEGQLREGCSLLDAAISLHPTPAVAGVPDAAAISFIKAHEGWPRGYYTGGFGWMDGDGNGQINVSLRSAFIHYPHACMFAGCGIVAGSDAATEWEESEWKLAPMRTALGDFREGDAT